MGSWSSRGRPKGSLMASDGQPAGAGKPAAAGARARANGDGAPRTGLLVDWGGVLTTNLFASFHAYCLKAELDPTTVLGRFRSDPAARELLIALETGELEEQAFEHRFAMLLKVEPDGLIDGLFPDVEPEGPLPDPGPIPPVAGALPATRSN